MRRPSRADDAARVKAIERTTNHDVKAVEYWLKERFAGDRRRSRGSREFIHFACTSEDINNLAHGADARRARGATCCCRRCATSRRRCAALAHAHADAADALAHARPARDADHARQGDRQRLRAPRAPDRRDRARAAQGQDQRRGRQLQRARRRVSGRRLGAPCRASRRRVWASSSIRTRRRSSRTTAWPSCSTRSRAPTPILIDLDRDVWGYISLGYFRQKREGGRSRLVDDAAQGQSDRLRELRRQPRPRQRAAAAPRGKAADLALAARPHRFDGAAQHGRGARPRAARLGVAARRGSAQLEVDAARIAADLDANWEVLAEPIQTVMRRYGVAESVRAAEGADARPVTGMTRETLHAFIDGLALPDDAKARLKALTPATLHRHGRGARAARLTQARRDASSRASAPGACALRRSRMNVRHRGDQRHDDDRRSRST